MTTKTESPIVTDHCDEADFEEILTKAEANARGFRERHFVEGLVERFDDFGASMFLSDKQWDWLIRIHERGDER